MASIADAVSRFSFLVMRLRLSVSACLVLVSMSVILKEGYSMFLLKNIKMYMLTVVAFLLSLDLNGTLVGNV